jgi:hypothetical protein
MKFEADDPRRRTLLQWLAAGAFGGASLGSQEALAQLLGAPPTKLPAGRSVYRIAGDVTVDGKRATLETVVNGGSVVETARNSEIVYVVGESAYIAREATKVIVETAEPSSRIVSGLKLLQGKLLSVFPSRRPVQMTTQVASIGIRGTGVYLESDPSQTYFCTCYGITDVASLKDPESKDTVAATHHDKPLYVLADQPGGKAIRPAPFINHTDQELQLIETLVGREPPFIFPKSDYTGPRRNY